MTHPGLCTGCQRLLDVSGLWKHLGVATEKYAAIDRILSLGGGFESMTEE
jgi:hypothetical protein